VNAIRSALVLGAFLLTSASLVDAAPPVLVVDQFYAVRLPDRFHGPEHTDEHVTLAYHSPTRRIYFQGGDYAFALPDGSYGQNSYSQHMWSLDLAARFADPTNRNAGWTHEHEYCAAPGEQMPKRPGYVGFTSVPDQNVLIHIPGEEVPSNGGNCPGETSAYDSDAQYLRNHIMTFSPLTKWWIDLSANAAVGVSVSRNSRPWMSGYDETLKKIVRLGTNDSNGTRIELLDLDRASTGYLTWKKTDVDTLIWSGGVGPQRQPWTLDPTRHVIYTGSRYARQLAVVDYVNNTVTSLGSLPGDASLSSDDTYLCFDWNARQLVYVERRSPGNNLLGGTDIAGRVWRYAVDTRGPWMEITHLPMVSLGGEPIPSTPFDRRFSPYGSDDSIPHATSLVFDPDNNVMWFFGTKSEGTLYYADQFSYALRQIDARPLPSPRSSAPPLPTLPPPAQGPGLTGLTPSTVGAGNAGFNLAVTGTGFASGLNATVGGQARTVIFSSATRVTIGVLAADVVKVGNVAVQVTNPGSCAVPGTVPGPTGGCGSNTMRLMVAPPTPAPPPPPPAYPNIEIQITPPDCVDVSVNGVPIPGSCPTPVAAAKPSGG